MTIQAMGAVLRQANAPFKLEPIELAELAPGEVLVRNDACGICHTDVIAGGMVPLPAVLGHEGCGTVELLGSGVSGLRVGDRVISSYPFCNACSGCHAGRPYHCVHHMRLGFGGRRLDGSATLSQEGAALSGAFFQQSSFATHSVVPQHNLVIAEQAYPAEHLAAIPCGVQTGAGAILNTFGVSAGDSLAVLGCGTVGMSAVMAAKLAGAWPIVAVDMHQNRLDLALELGATQVINASQGEVGRRILDICPNGVRYALETSGHEAALNDALQALAIGGRCGMVIAPHMGRQYPFDTSQIFKKAASLEGVIQGSAVPRSFLPRLLDFQREGRFPFERLIKTYPFEQINRAFEDAANGSTVKAVLMFSH
ncbi:NAD(P)-dependent alcohol dehydrogenase [Aquabacterium sp.]|uniref:NAD(P)-dependent alcohol dehydrogenase n=1 Tax=Aquabacterium sp. TaxID=1872578 RepID=UPI003D6C9346